MARTLTCLAILLIVAGSIFAQSSINTSDGVKIGGITQWIGVKGKDNKPLLFFLHGGPGFSSREYSKKFLGALKNDFLVAQWDQRETGRTAAWNKTRDSLSLNQFHNDLYEVVQYLLKKYSREKLFLVGYSWGGFLGLNFANNHPDLLYAYISVSGLIHGIESEHITFNYLMAKAKETNNVEAIKELSQIELPFKDWEDIYFQRKWAAYFSGKDASARSFPPSLFQTWSTTWFNLFNEALKVNYFENAPVINCPIYFFVSKKDLVCNYTITEKYYRSLEAPKKEIIWFDRSTHQIPTDEPKRFANELVRIGRAYQEN